MLIVHSVTSLCIRSIQAFQQLSSKVQDSIQQIRGNMTRLLSGTYADVLPPHATLTLPCESPSGAYRKPLRRRACGVASALAIAMSLGLSPADGTTNHSFTPKDYIRSLLPPKEALCLIKLYGKESAFRVDAVGNIGGAIQAYGIPQLKNPLIKDMSAFNQIDYGIKYVAHRYDTACDAYSHWLKKGWH